MFSSRCQVYGMHCNPNIVSLRIRSVTLINTTDWYLMGYAARPWEQDRWFWIARVPVFSSSQYRFLRWRPVLLSGHHTLYRLTALVTRCLGNSHRRFFLVFANRSVFILVSPCATPPHLRPLRLSLSQQFKPHWRVPGNCSSPPLFSLSPLFIFLSKWYSPN